MAKVRIDASGHAVDLDGRPSGSKRDGVGAGQVRPLFPSEGAVLVDVFGQRLPATTIGLNVAFKRMDEREVVVGNAGRCETGSQVETDLLPAVATAEPEPNLSPTGSRGGAGVRHRRHPTPVTVFPHRPSEGSWGAFTLVERRREKRGWCTHGLPRIRALHVRQPLRQRSARTTALLRR